jgi:hypothetical protein
VGVGCLSCRQRCHIPSLVRLGMERVGGQIIQDRKELGALIEEGCWEPWPAVNLDKRELRGRSRPHMAL